MTAFYPYAQPLPAVSYQSVGTFVLPSPMPMARLSNPVSQVKPVQQASAPINKPEPIKEPTKPISERRAERLKELKSKQYSMFDIPYDLLELETKTNGPCAYDPKTEESKLEVQCICGGHQKETGSLKCCECGKLSHFKCAGRNA